MRPWRAPCRWGGSAPPKRCAAVVAFLCSDAAGYVTGRAGAGRRRARHGPLRPLRPLRSLSTESLGHNDAIARRATLMERDEALSALREVAVEVLSVDGATVQEDARFKEDLDADSLDLVELVMGLEERFDISVPEEDLDGVATVGQAVDLVMAKVAAKSMSQRIPRPPRTPAHRRHRPRGQDPGRHRRRRAMWSTIRAGKRMARTITIFDPTDAARAHRLRGPRLRPGRVLRAEGGPPPGPRDPARVRRGRGRDRRTPASSVPTRARCAVIAATGIGGLHDARRRTARSTSSGAPRG